MFKIPCPVALLTVRGCPLPMAHDLGHLIKNAGRVAFIDTGTFETLPHTLAAPKTLSLTPETMGCVMLTHIHLDHSGSAGVMMEVFPNARLVLHPRGAHHMSEPSKLMAGIDAVYGKACTRDLRCDRPVL